MFVPLTCYFFKRGIEITCDVQITDFYIEDDEGWNNSFTEVIGLGSQNVVYLQERQQQHNGVDEG